MGLDSLLGSRRGGADSAFSGFLSSFGGGGGADSSFGFSSFRSSGADDATTGEQVNAIRDHEGDRHGLTFTLSTLFNPEEISAYGNCILLCRQELDDLSRNRSVNRYVHLVRLDRRYFLVNLNRIAHFLRP